MPPMTTDRLLEIAKGATAEARETKELADEVIRLRDALQGCRLGADRIRSEVAMARPEKHLGDWGPKRLHPQIDPPGTLCNICEVPGCDGYGH